MKSMTMLRGISPSDWAKIVGLIFVAGSIYATRSNEISVIKADIVRHESMLNKIDDTQRIALQNQAVLTQRFVDHLATGGK